MKKVLLLSLLLEVVYFIKVNSITFDGRLFYLTSECTQPDFVIKNYSGTNWKNNLQELPQENLHERTPPRLEGRICKLQML